MHAKLAGVVAVALGAATSVAFTAGSTRSAPSIWVAPALHALRPDASPPPGAPHELRLRALRGECETAQVAVAAGRRPLADVRVRVATGPGPDVTVRLFREELVELPKGTGPDGAPGRWPDPLVPERDPWFGEPRRAFPFDVPAAETRAVWVEACVAAGAQPGRRAALLAVEAVGLAVELPLVLEVERSAIPATATFPTSFGFSARRAAVGHLGRPGTAAEIAELDRLYRSALLAHRISAHGGTMEPPPFTRGPDGLEVSFDAYDRELAPFLDGTALPGGARATTTELRTHPQLRGDEERVAYWRAIARHHHERGWSAVLFDYATDEPRREDLPDVARRARLVKSADPSIRVLLTAALDEGLADVVDLWAPNLNCLFVRDRADEYCRWRAPRAAYRASPWWYVSCSSFGCGEGPQAAAQRRYFSGWPSYAVDAPGARLRGLAFLAHREGIGGELYWDTVFAYAPEGKPRDPWSGADLRAFGGNGDGTLFYPGTPERIGGTRHVPVTSIRLSHVRDALEDLELLRLVEAAGGGALARAESERLAPAPWRLADDPRAYAAARERLLAFLRR